VVYCYDHPLCVSQSLRCVWSPPSGRTHASNHVSRAGGRRAWSLNRQFSTWYYCILCQQPATAPSSDGETNWMLQRMCCACGHLWRYYANHESNEGMEEWSRMGTAGSICHLRQNYGNLSSWRFKTHPIWRRVTGTSWVTCANTLHSTIEVTSDERWAIVDWWKKVSTILRINNNSLVTRHRNK